MNVVHIILSNTRVHMRRHIFTDEMLVLYMGSLDINSKLRLDSVVIFLGKRPIFLVKRFPSFKYYMFILLSHFSYSFVRHSQSAFFNHSVIWNEFVLLVNRSCWFACWFICFHMVTQLDIDIYLEILAYPLSIHTVPQHIVAQAQNSHDGFPYEKKTWREVIRSCLGVRILQVIIAVSYCPM